MFCKFSFSAWLGSVWRFERRTFYTGGSLRAKLIKHLASSHSKMLGLTLNETNIENSSFKSLDLHTIASEYAPKTHSWNPMDSKSCSFLNFVTLLVSTAWDKVSSLWHFIIVRKELTLPQSKCINDKLTEHETYCMQNNHLSPTKSTLVELTDNNEYNSKHMSSLQQLVLHWWKFVPNHWNV